MDINNKVKSGNAFYLFVMVYCLLVPIPIGVIFEIAGIFFDIGLVAALIIPTVIIMTFPVILYFGITNKKFMEVLPIKKVSLKNVILIIAICICIQPVMTFLSALAMLFSENNINDVAMGLVSYPYILSLTAIAISPAIFEEILMRGAVMDAYDGLDLKKLAILNGVFFGFLHGDVQQFLYAALLGALFVYFVKLTGSILASMLGHFIINGTQITTAYFVDFGETASTAITITDVVQCFFIAIPFCIIVILLLKMFIKNNKETYDEYNLKSQSYGPVKVVDKYFMGIVGVYILTLAINYLIY